MLGLSDELSMVVKRLFDLVGALALMILALPVLMIASVAILFSMGWPFLFRQPRAGLRGVPFVLYKLRTLSEQRDAKGQLLPDEQRGAPVGSFLRRTSIDELPGLWNVLKGEMSLVGPRPLLVEYLPYFNVRQKIRLAMKPGITGWAQVNGRNIIDWDKKLELDAWYVEHWSLWLDLRILARTVGIVLKQEGISQPGHATASKFQAEKRRSGLE